MSIRKLVVIDLTAADTALFERYERKVVRMLGTYGAQLESSVRSTDGLTETHVLCFPDAQRFEKFLANPGRVALKEEWALTGATSTISDVRLVAYL